MPKIHWENASSSPWIGGLFCANCGTPYGPFYNPTKICIFPNSLLWPFSFLPSSLSISFTSQKRMTWLNLKRLQNSLSPHRSRNMAIVHGRFFRPYLNKEQSILEGDMPFESPKCPLKSGLPICWIDKIIYKICGFYSNKLSFFVLKDQIWISKLKRWISLQFYSHFLEDILGFSMAYRLLRLAIALWATAQN